MIVDSHQHFWIYDPGDSEFSWINDELGAIRKTFLPSDVEPSLKENKVDYCVAIQAAQREEETDFLLKLANENPIVKGVVGWVDLRAPNISERLDHFHRFPLIRGFRHIVQDEADPQFLLKEDFCRGIAELAKYDFTYDILVLPHQLPMALEFIQRFPNQRFVMDHLAKPWTRETEFSDWEQLIRVIGHQPNVHCKLSGLHLQNGDPKDFTPYLDVVLHAFGPEKLMFGSNWPLCLVAADYSWSKKIVTDHIQSLSKAEQSAIMGENAAKCYKILEIG